MLRPAILALALAVGLAGPAALAAQQHQHPQPATKAAASRDTISGVLIGIDTLKAAGMMAGMKHDMAAMKHDSGMKHDMAAMKHDSGGMKHDMAAMKHDSGGMKHDMAAMEGGMGEMNHAEHHQMMTDGGGGLALRILVGSDTVSAHLGPIWYLKQQNPDGFAIGERLTVDGVAMKHEAKPHWMAYTVTRGGLEIVLRDDQGQPRWAGAMMARMKAKTPQ